MQVFTLSGVDIFGGYLLGMDPIVIPNILYISQNIFHWISFELQTIKSKFKNKNNKTTTKKKKKKKGSRGQRYSHPNCSKMNCHPIKKLKITQN
jgi:hypothetical protein